MWSKTFDKRPHRRGNFSLRKFNVALNSFCGQSIGILVNNTWGNPNVRTTGNGAWWHAENPDIIPSQKCPFLSEIWTLIIYIIPSTQPSANPKQQLNWFSHFCRAHGHYRQTKKISPVRDWWSTPLEWLSSTRDLHLNFVWDHTAYRRASVIYISNFIEIGKTFFWMD